jgi:hypothetical protein
MMKTQAGSPKRKIDTVRSLVFALSCVLALAVSLVPLPIVGAQRSEVAGVVETRDLFSAAADLPGAWFVHTATAANISSNWTEIDHPLTNNKPNAIVLVTQNWNPGGTGGVYNNHPIGVWYRSSTKKWAIFNQDIAAMPIGADFNVLIPTAGAGAFVHTATAANISSNWTDIDHPLSNNNPNAIVLVTQNWNPGGGSGQYNDHAIGVWYNSSTLKWAIFNQDIAAMPAGADFNVLIRTAGRDAFVHTATAANITSNSTFIDHPFSNNNPNAIVLVTQNWNPGGGSGKYNDHPIGVWYSTTAKKWAIFNQDIASMPIGADFNVLIPVTDLAAFVHTATAANITSNSTFIDHPLTNNNPHAIVLATQNWNPGGTGGIYNDHAIGVWYSTGAKKWAVFNQDIAAMPPGAAFNVLIPPVDTSVFVHTATAANITSHWTVIDHPLTNNRPNAIVLVTQNWNPSGGGGKYNDHAIGVWYVSATKKWAIFNQDFAAMPAGADFNVLIPTAGADAFVHTATAANVTSNWTVIDHPLSNNNPNAIVLVTQNWNPSGGSGQYNDHAIGVWYISSAKKWAIFNQDRAAMPAGADFNVVVIPHYKVYIPLVLRDT